MARSTLSLVVHHHHQSVLDPHRVGEGQEDPIGDLGEREHRDHGLGDLPDGDAVGLAIAVEEAVHEVLEAVAQRVEGQDRQEQERHLEPAEADVQLRDHRVSKGDEKGKDPGNRERGEAVGSGSLGFEPESRRGDFLTIP